MNRGQLSIIRLASFNDAETDERRRPGRIVCDKLRCGSARVLDISKTGAKLELRGLFGPNIGDQRIITFDTAMGKSVEFTCKIMWVRRTGMSSHEVGAQFEGLTPDQQAQLTRIAHVHSKRTMLDDAA